MIKEKIKTIYFSRQVLWDMVKMQFKAKYAASMLGVSWAILTPILITMAINFVFTVVFKREEKHFELFLLSGLLPWTFFSVSLSEGTSSILDKVRLLRQFNVPKEFLPLSCVLANFLNFLLGLLIVFPLFLIFNHRLPFLLPFLIITLFLHLLFTIGLGVLLSALNIFFRDIGHLLPIVLMFWFWITPVFYAVEMIPLRYRWVVDFNPIVPYIVSYRDVLFSGTVPGVHSFSAAFFWAFTSIGAGLGIFLRLEQNILKSI
jgi:lipopolysaccharide transport system permease protein